MNPNCGESYIDSPNWIKSEDKYNKSYQQKDKKGFQYPVIIALNHEKIGKHADRIAKIKLFINIYKLWRRTALSCSQRSISIIKSNNIKK